MLDTVGAVHETLASVTSPLFSTVTLVGGGRGSGVEDKAAAAGGRKEDSESEMKDEGSMAFPKKSYPMAL